MGAADVATTRLEPAVCLGSSQRSWVTNLITYVSDHGGLRVVGTVLTQDDADGMVFDVLVIDDVSSVLSPRLVDRLHTSGRSVVGVFDGERGALAIDRLRAAGVDATVAADASAADFVRVVVEVVRQRSIDRELADLVHEVDEVDEPAGRAAAPMRRQPAAKPVSDVGHIVVVTGSDGATEVAVGLAQVMSGRRASVVLVDMDTLEPSIAQRLAMQLTPNIFTATERLRLRSSLTDAFATHPEGFAVIAGIPNPREWESLSGTEAADLVTELATGFAVVIVKINRHLEDLSSLGGSAGRFDVGRRLAVLADHVVAVTSPSPLGAARLLAMAGDLHHLSAAPIHVVVNQAPSSQFIQGEIGEEITRTLAPASLTFLPSDAKVRKASWQGAVVRSGGFVRRLSRLGEWLGPDRSAPVEAIAPEAALPTAPEVAPVMRDDPV